MHLIFSAIDTEARFRKFSWWFTSIETIYDVLNSVVARGSRLIQVEIIDNEQRTELPAEAFDGSFSSTSIAQLEQEWQQALSKPIDYHSVCHQRLIVLTRKQMQHCENRIAQLKLAIKLAEEQRQHVQDNVSTEPSRSESMNQTEIDLRQYQHHLARAESKQQMILDHLNQLQNNNDTCQ